jgi:soluble lytic murein transglycosylase
MLFTSYKKPRAQCKNFADSPRAMSTSAFSTFLLNTALLGILFALGASTAMAIPNRSVTSHIASHYPNNIVQLREHYQLALAALDAGDEAQYQSLRKKLNNYPLRGYLDYREMALSIDATNSKRIQRYRDNYSNSSFSAERLAQRLSSKRLYHLAATRNWPDFIKLYEQNGYGKPKTTLQCHYATALNNTGNTATALELATSLWLAPRSQPTACDKVFSALQQSGSAKQISSNLAWQRFSAAFANNQITLSKYLQRYLDAKHNEQAQQLLAFYRRPETLARQWTQFKKLQPQFASDGDYRKSQKLLLQRAIRNNVEAADKLFRQLNSQAKTDTQLATAIPNLKAYAIQRYALKDYNGLNKFYDKLGEPRDSVSLEWMIRSALARGQWSEAGDFIALLPAKQRAHDRWQYWQLRIAQLQNDLNQNQQSALIELAGKANFYGFFSAHTLDQPATIKPQSIDLETQIIAELLDNSQLVQALEYFLQGQINEANNRWFAATGHYSSAQKINAAYLASYYGWHHQAISTLATAQAWQHYAVRFPDIMTDSFSSRARELKQPAHWFYATARQESGLAEHARSSAGALGLMQILPSTAAAQAKSLDMKYQRDLLFDPHYSIVIGSAYLDALHNRYNNRALSSAAYNAGPRRVDQWLANLQQPIPLDAWIESIRFSETRQYVQNILSFSLIHATLHNKNVAFKNNPAALHPFIANEDVTVRPLAQQLATQLAQNTH